MGKNVLSARTWTEDWLLRASTCVPVCDKRTTEGGAPRIGTRPALSQQRGTQTSLFEIIEIMNDFDSA